MLGPFFYSKVKKRPQSFQVIISFAAHIIFCYTTTHSVLRYHNMSLEIILTGAGAVLAIGIIVALVWLWHVDKKFSSFFAGGKAAGLEEVMMEIRDELETSAATRSIIEAHMKSLESRAQKSIQHVGVVRFNPFQDAGGDQSFAVALLDEGRDGVVISSLYSRDGVRVYAKPIMGGTSSYQLSEEEQRAIQEALTPSQNSKGKSDTSRHF